MAFFANSNLKKAVALIWLLAYSVDAIERVDLGTAVEFAILAKTAVTTAGVTSVTGDIGASPITAAALTGFALILDSSSQFTTSALVTGKVWAADYAAPTPLKMSTAILDMQTAYADAAGRLGPKHENLGTTTGAVIGLTLTPGLYKWSTAVGIVTSLTFYGSSDDVWILQIAGALDVSSGTEIVLTGGARAENIFWQISGATTFGTAAHVEGVFLCATSIVFMAGSSMNGAALAQTAVTLSAATIAIATAPVATTTTTIPTEEAMSTTTTEPSSGGVLDGLFDQFKSQINNTDSLEDRLEELRNFGLENNTTIAEEAPGFEISATANVSLLTNGSLLLGNGSLFDTSCAHVAASWAFAMCWALV